MPTKLQFDNDHSVTVDEDVNAVESALRTAPPGVAGLVSFTVKGAKLLVNAALVRAVGAAPEPGSASTTESPWG